MPTGHGLAILCIILDPTILWNSILTDIDYTITTHAKVLRVPFEDNQLDKLFFSCLKSTKNSKLT